MKKNLALAMLYGVCTVLALPPFFFLPLALVGFTGFYLLLARAENLRQVFWLGWCFGFAHHVVGLYWISNALLTDPERFAWMVPFAISLIPAVLAIYIGLVTALHHYLLRRSALPHVSLRGIVLFTVLWVIVEWLRAHLFTGFPWNLIGYAFNLSEITMQMGSLLGIYGLSFLLVLAATAPALFYRRQWLSPLICTVLLPLLLVGFGYYRLQHAITGHTKTSLFLVQANTSQPQRHDEAARAERFLQHLQLSRNAPRGSVVIWPESGVPYILHEEPQIRKMIYQAIGGNLLLTGSTRLKHTEAGDDFEAWNSLEMVQNGEIIGFYNKSRLVPFGEFVPMRWLIPFVETVTNGTRDFSRGEGATVRAAPGVPAFSPLICYEAIYPEYHPETEKMKWMLNVTNDAWFGISSGPYQHFEMTRMRAVEQGVPLVRAANTGISAVIDSYGRIVKALPLGNIGTLTVFLPNPLPENTFYSHYGDWPLGLILFTLLIITNAPLRIGRNGKFKLNFQGKKMHTARS